MKTKLLPCFFLSTFIFLISALKSHAQSPWRAKLFVHFIEDPTGKVITDTAWFGCDSLGNDGYQQGLDELDTVYNQNKVFFSDPLTQTQLGLASHYNLSTSIKAFKKNETVSFKLKANGWVFAVSWDTTEFIYEQPDFKLYTTNLFCKECYLSAWEREQHTLMSRDPVGSHKFYGRDSIDILQGNGMELEIRLRFKDTSTVGLRDLDDVKFMSYSIKGNPVSNEITIDFEKQFTGQIQLLNNLGQAIHTLNIQNQYSAKISIDHLPSGIYYFHISNGKDHSKPTKILKL